MTNDRKGLNRVIQLKRETEKSTKPKLTEEQRKTQVKKWTTFYRRNIDIYAEEVIKEFENPQKNYVYITDDVKKVCFNGEENIEIEETLNEEELEQMFRQVENEFR